MKEIFLSLMMAAAVVATTSVSAFAEDRPYTVSEGNGQEAEVEITGNIADERDAVLPSTITVTVPTTTTFTVDKTGTLKAPNITINNQGDEPVSVIAHSFQDTTTNKGITVVGDSEMTDPTNVERTKVTLKLGGNGGSVALKSDSGNSNGIYKLDGTEADADTVIGTVRKGQPLNLTLSGTAGTQGNALKTAVNDRFTLILKLKKAR